ncbi:hypothetical protein [Paenibacillus flagellatus]|uniref:Uncharacterized protein n=1 Tax=Paenibacillus flagellatus TaxID=2211139 RepID=A0A2V5KXY1_9BACL|nr:hypothetical protein [Paenibacillus flagellatus]PYI57417.1 hypothetical protein DLM86_02975 [Paenibacillus flagellatus]
MEAMNSVQEQTTTGTTAFDPFYVEFKHAAHLPQWLKLQHEVRAGLEKLMAESVRVVPPVELAARLDALNDRIAAYNDHVPNVYLRKPALTPANWTDQYESWQ